jgi:hypothetical protein
MTAVMEEKEVYLSDFARFEQSLKEDDRGPLHQARQAAIEEERRGPRRLDPPYEAAR